MWHEWIHATLRRLGVPYMAEVNLNPWLPDGWGGTADAVVWNPELKAFVLCDFKTQKGEGMRYIARDGAKDEHIWQASAYWHALKKMGLPLAKAVAVYYLPKNNTRSKDDVVEPVLADFAPLPAKQLHGEMDRRNARTQEYLEDLAKRDGPGPNGGGPSQSFQANVENWLSPALAPVQQRQQRVYFDRKTETHELKLVPHWSAAFCPFPDELCDCSSQGTTKIGMFDGGDYFPRPGYEDIEPEVFPN